MTTTLFIYNTIRNEYQLSLPTANLQIAAAWLRSKGCTFTTETDRVYKRTVIRFRNISLRWAAALSKKHGRKDAAAPKTAATSSRVRKQWVAIPAPAYQAEAIASPWESTEVVSPVRFMQDAGFHYQLCLPAAKPEVSTNSQLSGGVAHITTEVNETPLYLSPAFATSTQLRSLSNSKLYKLTQTHNIKGRSKLKGNADAMVNALVGLVRKSELKR
jgi:hypothetical protein